MGFAKEFRDFTIKGNVIDLAVGVVIGGAFGKIVTSFVGDVVMPLVNPLIPGGDWRTLEVGPGIKLGTFIGTIVDFIIIALAVFIAIKGINKMKKKQEAIPDKPAVPTRDQELLTEIRDLLSDKKV
ncbi:MAG TPA: large conductance mechanosensitive channel protein MscL [Flavobacteriales bacterium]|nr:large conductance mechanosensitive channel protein MscL [Flavobacteriales bacterium]